MKNVIVSFSLYLLLIAMAVLLQFVDRHSLPLAVLFALCSLLAAPFYEVNCRPLEGKDFIFACIFTFFCIVYWQFIHAEITMDHCWVIFTINFIAFVNLGCSNRYKILA